MAGLPRIAAGFGNPKVAAPGQVRTHALPQTTLTSECVVDAVATQAETVRSLDALIGV
jgi:hypothetical protein